MKTLENLIEKWHKNTANLQLLKSALLIFFHTKNILNKFHFAFKIKTILKDLKEIFVIDNILDFNISKKDIGLLKCLFPDEINDFNIFNKLMQHKTIYLLIKNKRNIKAYWYEYKFDFSNKIKIPHKFKVRAIFYSLPYKLKINNYSYLSLQRYFRLKNLYDTKKEFIKFANKIFTELEHNILLSESLFKEYNDFIKKYAYKNEISIKKLTIQLENLNFFDFPENKNYYDFIFDLEVRNNEINEFYGIVTIDNIILDEITKKEDLYLIDKLPFLRLVGYNIIDFDIKKLSELWNFKFLSSIIDIVDLFWVYNIIYPVNTGSALEDVLDFLNIKITERHTSKGDTIATFYLWQKIKKIIGFNNRTKKISGLLKQDFLYPEISITINQNLEVETKNLLVSNYNYINSILQIIQLYRQQNFSIFTDTNNSLRKVIINICALLKINLKEFSKYFIVIDEHSVNLDYKKLKLSKNLHPYLKLYFNKLKIYNINTFSLLSLPQNVEDKTSLLYKYNEIIDTIKSATEYKIENKKFIICKLPYSKLKNLNLKNRYIIFDNLTRLDFLLTESYATKKEIKIDETISKEMDYNRFIPVNEFNDIYNTDISQESKKNLEGIKKKQDKIYKIKYKLFWQQDFFKQMDNADKKFYLTSFIDTTNKGEKYYKIFWRLKSNEIVSLYKPNYDFNLIKYTLNFKLTKFNLSDYYNNVLNLLHNIYAENSRIIINSYNEEEKNIFHNYLKKYYNENIYVLDNLTKFKKQIRYKKSYILISSLYERSKIKAGNIDYFFIPHLPIYTDTYFINKYRKDFILNNPDDIEITNNFPELLNYSNDYLFELMNVLSFYSVYINLFNMINDILNENNIKNILIVYTKSIKLGFLQNYHNEIIRYFENISKSLVEKETIKHSLVDKELLQSLLTEHKIEITPDKYTSILKKYWGKNTTFRIFNKKQDSFPDKNFILNKEGNITQADIIHYLMRSFTNVKEIKNKDSFIIAATGKGKSLIYQIPAILLSEDIVPGMSLIVSPLISLMKDQVDALKNKGIGSVVFINSTLSKQKQKTFINLVKIGYYNIVYAAPETIINNKDFREMLEYRKPDLLVIDEAHSVSQWGHDFRIDYFKLQDFFANLYNTTDLFPKAAFTATAKLNPENPQESIVNDVIRILNLDITPDEVIKSTTIRKNLYYKVEKLQDKNEKLEFIVNLLKNPIEYIKKNNIPQNAFSQNPLKTIIYCATRNDTETIAKKISKQAKLNFKPYHAGLSDIEKEETQNMFKNGKIDGICATIAFGMGVDVPDIRIVIHYSLSQSVEHYYQESGRAGRDGKPSLCLLLYANDDERQVRHIVNSNNILLPDFENMKQFFKDTIEFEYIDKNVRTIDVNALKMNLLVNAGDNPEESNKANSIMFYMSKYYNPDYAIIEDYRLVNPLIRYKLLRKEVGKTNISNDKYLNQKFVRVFNVLKNHYESIYKKDIIDYVEIGYSEIYKGVNYNISDGKNRIKYSEIYQILYHLLREKNIEIESLQKYTIDNKNNKSILPLIEKMVNRTIESLYYHNNYFIGNIRYFDSLESIKSHYNIDFVSFIEMLWGILYDVVKIYSDKEINFKWRYSDNKIILYKIVEDILNLYDVKAMVQKSFNKFFSYINRLSNFFNNEEKSIYKIIDEFMSGSTVNRNPKLWEYAITILEDLHIIQKTDNNSIARFYKIDFQKNLFDENSFNFETQYKIFESLHKVYRYRDASMSLLVNTYINHIDGFAMRREFFEDFFFTSKYDDILNKRNFEDNNIINDIKQWHWKIILQKRNNHYNEIIKNPFKAIREVINCYTNKGTTIKEINIQRNNNNFNTFLTFYKILSEYLDITAPSRNKSALIVVKRNDDKNIIERSLNILNNENNQGIGNLLFITDVLTKASFVRRSLQSISPIINFNVRENAKALEKNEIPEDKKDHFWKYLNYFFREDKIINFKIKNRSLRVNNSSNNISNPKYLLNEIINICNIYSKEQDYFKLGFISWDFEQDLLTVLMQKLNEIKKINFVNKFFSKVLLNKYKLIVYDENLHTNEVNLIKHINASAVFIKLSKDNIASKTNKDEQKLFDKVFKNIEQKLPLKVMIKNYDEYLNLLKNHDLTSVSSRFKKD